MCVYVWKYSIFLTDFSKIEVMSFFLELSDFRKEFFLNKFEIIY